MTYLPFYINQSVITHKSDILIYLKLYVINFVFNRKHLQRFLISYELIIVTINISKMYKFTLSNTVTIHKKKTSCTP